MVAHATNAFDRVLGGLAKSLTVEVAEHISQLKLDSETQDLLDQLAAKASAGTLTDAERTDYLDLVEAIDFLAVFQAKARSILVRQPRA